MSITDPGYEADPLDDYSPFRPLCSSNNRLNNSKKLQFLRTRSLTGDIKKKLHLPSTIHFLNKKSKPVSSIDDNFDTAKQDTRRDSGCFSIYTDGGSSTGSPQDGDFDLFENDTPTDTNMKFGIKRAMSLNFIRRTRRKSVDKPRKGNKQDANNENTVSQPEQEDSSTNDIKNNKKYSNKNNILWERAKRRALKIINRNKQDSDGICLLNEMEEPEDTVVDTESLTRSFSSDDIYVQYTKTRTPKKHYEHVFPQQYRLDKNGSNGTNYEADASEFSIARFIDQAEQAAKSDILDCDMFGVTKSYAEYPSIRDLNFDDVGQRKISRNLSYSVNDLFDIFEKS